MKTLKTLVKTETNDWSKCDFCFSITVAKKPAYRLTIRNDETNWAIDIRGMCEDCKTKYDNKEFRECERCGRIERRGNRSIKACICAFEKDDELKKTQTYVEPERYSTQLERKINELSLEKKDLETAVELSFGAIKTAEVWGKSRTEQDLLEENKELKKRIEVLERENQELKDQILTQIEVPPKG